MSFGMGGVGCLFGLVHGRCGSHVAGQVVGDLDPRQTLAIMVMGLRHKGGGIVQRGGIEVDLARPIVGSIGYLRSACGTMPALYPACAAAAFGQRSGDVYAVWRDAQKRSEGCCGGASATVAMAMACPKHRACAAPRHGATCATACQICHGRSFGHGVTPQPIPKSRMKKSSAPAFAT